MPYRDDLDAADLLRTEPEVREERRRLRFEVDALQAEVDALDVTSGAYQQANARLDALIEKERAADARLAEIEAARRAFAVAQDARGAVLRTEDSPRGTELRALDASMAALEHQLGSLDDVLRVSDRALAIAGDLVENARGVERSGSALQTMGRVIATLASDTSAAGDHARMVARLRDSVPVMQSALAELLVAFGEHSAGYPLDVPARSDVQLYATAPVTEPADESLLARSAADVVTSLDRFVSVLTTERGRLLAQRALIAAQQEALIADTPRSPT